MSKDLLNFKLLITIDNVPLPVFITTVMSHQAVLVRGGHLKAYRVKM